MSRTKTASSHQKAFSSASLRSYRVSALAVHSEFDPNVIHLVEDFARYYAERSGLSPSGVQYLSGSMPCIVIPTRQGSRAEAATVGGLVTYYVARAVSTENIIRCYTASRVTNWSHTNRDERLQLLSIAPFFCRGDRDGTAILKRIWSTCTKSDRKEIYGVAAFTQFAKQLQIKSRFLPPPPRPQTSAQYEPEKNTSDSERFTLDPDPNKHDS